MKQTKVALGYLLLVMLAACAPMGPSSPRSAPRTPTIDLTASSAEFEREIKGDPHPLSAVRGLAVDQDGNLYVVDCEGNRIQKFDSEGEFITTWGNEGAGDGEFEFWLWFESGVDRRPVGDVAVDAQGQVYVADSGNSRIQVFDSDGQFLAKWGEEGVGDGQFYCPVGVAVGPEGDVYVTDVSRGDAQRFDSRGQFLGAWKVPGMGGEFVTAPAVDGQGNVYVPVWDAQEVRKFDHEGKLLSTIGEGGKGDGQFQKPMVVAVDRQGNVYVADELTHSVQKFDSEGSFLSRWGSTGAGEGEFRNPSGLAVAVEGSIYVADFGNKRVQKFRQQ